MRVLVVYLAVSMVIQMAEGSAPTVSRHGVFFCMSAPLTGSFFLWFSHSVLCDVQQPAIESEMPLRL